VYQLYARFRRRLLLAREQYRLERQHGLAQKGDDGGVALFFELQQPLFFRIRPEHELGPGVGFFSRARGGAGHQAGGHPGPERGQEHGQGEARQAEPPGAALGFQCLPGEAQREQR